MGLDKRVTGKIAERIVMNELEAYGYRATDLNKDGLSANADLLAAKGGKIWQIQVKGCLNKPNERWWIQYGHCTPEEVRRERSVFNGKDSFYTAQYVALVALRSAKEYRCFLMPVKHAEEAVQANLDRYYRQPKSSDGGERKPNKIWVYVEGSAKERVRSELLDRERKIIQRHENAWELK